MSDAGGSNWCSRGTTTARTLASPHRKAQHGAQDCQLALQLTLQALPLRALLYAGHLNDGGAAIVHNNAIKAQGLVQPGQREIGAVTFRVAALQQMMQAEQPGSPPAAWV